MSNGTLGTILQQGSQGLVSGLQTGLNIAETINRRKERQLQRQRENAEMNRKLLAFAAQQEIKRKKEEDRISQLRIDRLQNIANLPGTPVEVQADLFKEVGQLSGVDLGDVSTRLSPDKREQFFTGVAALMKSFTDSKTGQVDMAGFRPNLNKLTSKWRQLGLDVSAQDKDVSQFVKEGITQSERAAKLQRDIQQEQPTKPVQELPLITETTVVNGKEVTTAKRGDQIISEIIKPAKTVKPRIETLTQKQNEAQDIIEKGIETKGEFGGVDLKASARKRDAINLVTPLLESNSGLSGFEAGSIATNLVSAVDETTPPQERAVVDTIIELILKDTSIDNISKLLIEAGIQPSKFGF